MFTFETAFIFLSVAVMVYLAKHLYRLISEHFEAAQKRKMMRSLDWGNTNRSTRKRRELEKMTRWQRYGITN